MGIAGGDGDVNTDCCAENAAAIAAINFELGGIHIDIITINDNVNVLAGDVADLNNAIAPIEPLFPYMTRRAYTLIDRGQLGILHLSMLSIGPTDIWPGKIIVPTQIAMVMYYDETNNLPFTNSPIVKVGWITANLDYLFIQNLDTNSEFWQAAHTNVHVTDISGNYNTALNGVNGLGSPHALGIELASALTGNASPGNNTVGVWIDYVEYPY